MAVLEMVQGDDRMVRTLVNDLTSGDPYVWTGSEVWFTAKQRWFDADDQAVVTKNSLTGGITLPDDGVVLAQIDAEDTKALQRGKVTLHYDVQIKNAAGKIFTVDRGELVVLPEVTVDD